MAAQAKIDPKGGVVSWSITISHLKVGIYQATLFDSANVVLQKWEDQRTDDSLPDEFEIKAKPSELVGGTLWWQAIVIDPTDAGGPYVGTVAIMQDRKVICQDSSLGSVPPGKGKMDSFTDQITFV